MDCGYQHAIELKDQIRFLKSIIETLLNVVRADLVCNFCENLFRMCSGNLDLTLSKYLCVFVNMAHEVFLLDEKVRKES